MRFGQNAVKTPGRARENHCVTKGLRFRAALFKGWQVQGSALVAPAGAKHPSHLSGGRISAPSPDGSLRAPSGTSASQKARLGAQPP